MLQITQTGIRPHVRINGAWTIQEAENVNLIFPDGRLSLDQWYKCHVSCDKEAINIKIDDKKGEVLNRQWRLPQGNLIFSFKRDEEDTRPVNIPFPINLEYGTVGFRNSGNEKALMKNVLVEKI
jgi:hypothetical protein